ncbi:MAG TPA: xanthine dehydrogenase family protein molybdopterin-binding subunit, partial [Acetobacteraceae bacterium]|nr:xanthine dehydrogenase family protein molybdopterin-binding subunit [Acetobacteraceae bacterium]
MTSFPEAAPANAVTAPPTEPLIDAIGPSRPRVEGGLKVSGFAQYAADLPMDDLVFGSLVASTISRGRITSIDASAVLGMPGVLAVLDHTNAPRLNPEAGNPIFGPDGGLQLLQSDEVPFAGRPVALVLAETLEQARAAAEALPVSYEEHPHDIDFSADHPAARGALQVFGENARVGDVEAELAASDVVVDERYRSPEEHCCAMEPHSAVACWDGERLEAIDSNQGPFVIAATLAELFSLTLDQVRIRAEHVGGGFGSKGFCGPQLILAVMGTMHLGRPVRVTLTRRQVFLSVALRPATDQPIRIGADRDGRLRAIEHTAAFELSRLAEWIEACAEGAKTLYAAPAIATKLLTVPLDILPPNAMRAPGNTPGSFAIESAIDEVAERLAIDPLALRLANEPAVGPVSGLPFSQRNLVACLREGARRFGWAARDTRPRTRREGNLLLGTGLAAVSFMSPVFSNTASITAEEDGTFTVEIGASDIGQGARTAMTAVAADALRVPIEHIHLRIADSAFGPAWSAGGSAGTATWTWALTAAAAKVRAELNPAALPMTVTVDTTEAVAQLPRKERHAYSAIFA